MGEVQRAHRLLQSIPPPPPRTPPKTTLNSLKKLWEPWRASPSLLGTTAEMAGRRISDSLAHLTCALFVHGFSSSLLGQGMLGLMSIDGTLIINLAIPWWGGSLKFVFNIINAFIQK